MISKKTLAVLGVAALAMGLAVLPAWAKKKPCPKLCKDSIAACASAATTAANCGSLSGKPKRDCNKALRKAKKACKAYTIGKCKEVAVEKPDVCSPSGAFLD